jgi:predicted amidohydrolase
MKQHSHSHQASLFGVQAEPANFHLMWPQYDEFRPKPARAVTRTVGLFQFAPHERDAEGNVQFLVDSLQSIVDATIVLPESFLGSYSLEHAPPRPRKELSEILVPLRELTARNDLALVGTLPVEKGLRRTNNVVAMERGTLRFSLQDKGRLFGQEEHELQAGDQRRRQSIGGMVVSVQVCMDIVDPLPSRAAVTLGARAILGPSAVSVDYLRTIHKARSLENQVIGIFCNRTGEDLDGIVYLGRSAIFFPDGAELNAPRGGDQLLTASVDTSYVLGYVDRFGSRDD